MDLNFVGTFFVQVLLTYYTVHILKCIFGDRKKIQTHNQNMNKLRKVSIKTIDQQKQFVDLKYPKRQKLTKEKLLFGFLTLVFYVGTLISYRIIFNYFGYQIKFWFALMIIFTLPILLNLMLERFDLNKTDLTIFFKGARK